MAQPSIFNVTVVTGNLTDAEIIGYVRMTFINQKGRNETVNLFRLQDRTKTFIRGQTVEFSFKLMKKSPFVAIQITLKTTTPEDGMVLFSRFKC